MTRQRAQCDQEVRDAIERLEARGQRMNVSVKSLKACKHTESLIYFDRVYGSLASWQLCDHCGQEFNYTMLEPSKGVLPL